MRKLVIIDDEIIVAQSIEDILKNNGFANTEIATNYKQAKQIILNSLPDLILCDINLESKKNGIELMKEINTQYSIPFILVSAYSDLKILKEINKVSPYAYITKPFHEKQLLASVNGVFAAIENKNTSIPSEKELTVLKLIARGHATKQIAYELNLSYHTIETHRKNLLAKYGVKSMPELICMATHKGWIEYIEN